MENLWAPWRMEYILGNEDDQSCIFCPDKGAGYDRERLMPYIGPLVLVMMNRYPYNNGHLLVAPLRHAPEPADLTPEETIALWQTVNVVMDILKQDMKPDGFNVGLNLGVAAGAGVAGHLHVHVVPRWAGDTNFMTVMSDVRSIPEHLRQTFDRLQPLFARALEEA